MKGKTMTINLDTLKNRKRLITHGNCPDGLASAMLIAHAIPGIEVEFCLYSTEQHTQMDAREGDIFCDFTPHRDRVQDFVDVGAVVLDHHKGALDIIECFRFGVFADEKSEPGVSGATLAFREVWLPLMFEQGREAIASKAQHFAEVAGVRDTWQKNDPRWAESCAQAEALMFFGADAMLTQAEHGGPFLTEEQFDVGRMLFEKKRDTAHAIAGRCFRVGDFWLHNEGLKYTSDVAEAMRVQGLDDGAKALAGFGYKVDGDSLDLVFSLRSLASDFDVAALAKANGGGGHTKAAGFVVKGGGATTPTGEFMRALKTAGLA